MKDRSLQIKEALESLKAAERAADFEALACHIAKRRWPTLVATERKSDGGEDLTSFFADTQGQRVRGAISLTGTLEKIRKDARRQRERHVKTDRLVFLTTEPIGNLEAADWCEKFKTEFKHDLVILGQAELISELEKPENDWLCVDYLHLDPLGEALATYFDHVIGRCDKLVLAGIDPKASDPNSSKRLDLANVYIELTTDLRRPLREGEAKPRRGDLELTGLAGGENTVPVSALEAASDHRRLVLSGKPGSGKTTFIRHLCLCLAQHFCHAEAGWLDRLKQSGWAGRALVPLVVELRFYARTLPPDVKGKPSPLALWDFFVSHSDYDFSRDGAKEALLQALEAGRALVIFEGLDEVPTGPQRAYVKQAIEAFAAAAQFKASRILVTCRSRAYAQEALHLQDLSQPKHLKFTDAPLADFDQPRILRFTQSWYVELARLDKSLEPTKSDRADRLYRALQAPSLWSQAGRPMLLTVMANVHAKNDKLPRERAQVYAEMVKILVESWDNVRLESQAPLRRLLEQAGKSEKELIGFLSELAYGAHARDQAKGKGREALADIPKHGKDGLLETLAAWCGSRDRAADLIDAVEQRAGLLVSPDVGADVFQFPHRSFQEYLAGVYLADQDDFETKAVELVNVADNSGDIGYWDETLKWAVGWIAHVSEGKRRWKEVPIVANALCQDGKCAPAVRRHKLTLAAELLTEMGQDKLTDARTTGGAACLDKVQQLLLARMAADDLPPMERAESGRLLGLLGDPRAAVVPCSVEALAEMEFCFVPPGPFWMGMDEEGRKELTKEYGIEQEKLYRETKLDQGFWIARHPVTVAQFNLFVDAGGYRQEEWWTEAVAAGLWKDGKIASRFWDQELSAVGDEWRERPGDSGPRFTPPNHPMVDVNWYEAMAFCRWLEKRLPLPAGLRLGLPSEAEWEKAARGGEQVLAEALVRSPASGLAQPDEPDWKPNELAQRAYLWGDAFDASLANCYETQVQATSAAGCFPKGHSPCGAHDLAGNVWEWTRSLWGSEAQKPQFSYPYDFDGRREDLNAPQEVLRVLRGGAWSLNTSDARCACRSQGYPDYRSLNLGFRLVASPFPSALRNL